MMNEQTPSAASLWLMTGDIPTGPFDPDQVHARLAAGEVTWETLACPLGGSTWLPLVQLPGFGPSVEGPSPDIARPEQPTPSSAGIASTSENVPSGQGSAPDRHDAASNTPLTNARLPTMANWICIYSLLVSPLYWFMNNASCCVTGPTYQENSPFFGADILLSLFSALIGLACTIVLFLGGFRLRNWSFAKSG